jgi:hypothetical protein
MGTINELKFRGSQVIEMMTLEMHKIRFESNVNLIQMKLMKVMRNYKKQSSLSYS